LGIGDGIAEPCLDDRQFLRLQVERFDVSAEQQAESIQRLLIVVLQLGRRLRGRTRNLSASNHGSNAQGNHHKVHSVFSHKPTAYETGPDLFMNCRDQPARRDIRGLKIEVQSSRGIYILTEYI